MSFVKSNRGGPFCKKGLPGPLPKNSYDLNPFPPYGFCGHLSHYPNRVRREAPLAVDHACRRRSYSEYRWQIPMSKVAIEIGHGAPIVH
jgi:hypothetical protein